MQNENEPTRRADDHQAHSHFTGPCQRSPESLPAYGGAAGGDAVMRDLKACAYLCGADMIMDADGSPHGWRVAE